MTSVKSVAVLAKDVPVAAKKNTRRTPVRRPKTAPTERESTRVSMRDTFGLELGYVLDKNNDPIKGSDGGPIKKDMMVRAFADKTQWVPKVDPNYVFPPDATKMFLLGMELKDRILLTGGTGVGKTTLGEQICARLNYNCVKINFDGGITRADLIGEPTVENKSMRFQYGILVHAFQMPGTLIILDEWDSISGECSFVLQRPLQRDDGKILIMETGGELVPLHPDNVICATGNTVGQGDETGLYSQGTRVQNYAQINRFSMTIKMSYLSPEKEVEMLCKRFSELKTKEAELLVRAVNAVRDGHANGQISVPLSPRDLINWAEKYLWLPCAMQAATYCFLNRMMAEDAEIVKQIIQRIFDE